MNDVKINYENPNQVVEVLRTNYPLKFPMDMNYIVAYCLDELDKNIILPVMHFADWMVEDMYSSVSTSNEYSRIYDKFKSLYMTLEYLTYDRMHRLNSEYTHFHFEEFVQCNIFDWSSETFIENAAFNIFTTFYCKKENGIYLNREQLAKHRKEAAEDMISKAQSTPPRPLVRECLSAVKNHTPEHMLMMLAVVQAFYTVVEYELDDIRRWCVVKGKCDIDK